MVRRRTSKTRFVAAGLCAVTLAALGIRFPVLAQSRPPQATDTRKVGALRMLDARVNYPDGFQRAIAARPGAAAGVERVFRSEAARVGTALRNLKQTMPSLEATLSLYTGGPESVQNKSGALTDAAPGASSEAIVRGFLAQHGAVYGLSEADLADLVALGDSPGGRSGLRMLRMEQQIGGRPIFQSETRFTLDREGRLVKSVGQFVPHARSFAPAEGGALGAPEAMARLLTADSKTAAPEAFAPIGESSGWSKFSGTHEFVTDTVYARRVLFPLAPGVLVDAWSIVMFTAGDQDWYAVVDAETGALLWRKNIRAYQSAHDARFRVYVQADGKTPADNPAPLSPTTATPGSNTQPPEILPTIVSMHAVYDAAASPNGWINDCPGGVCTANESQTLGNNVLACLDRTSGTLNVCDTDVGGVIDGNGRPTGNPDLNVRNRDFFGVAPRDFQTNYVPPPLLGNPEAGQTATGAGASGTNAFDQFRRGAITHLFYVANWYHDMLYALGFDEASANFQQTNFSGMGVGGDRVNADAQDGGSTNNANFSTPPDGVSGRAQMYRFTGPTIDRDGDLDAEILIHELTHGTSNRLVGNAAGLTWDPAAGLGEGWSDFYALALLNNTNADNPNASYAAGSYATYKLGGLLDNYLYAIRRFPYTTDNSVNPMTWADVDDVTNNLSGGIAPSPLNFNDNGGMEVHNSGEIWALSLWEVRSRVIANPAGANGDVPTGNTTMLEIVTDAMKMTPIEPSFIEGRNALFDADCATNACANEESIWAGFADRGLGYGAKAPFKVAFGYTASHQGIGESFLSPFLDVVNPTTDVAINDTASNNNGAIDPGEALKLTVTLTNPWRAASKAVTAGATATLSTTTPGVTIHDNTSTYGAIAPLGTGAGDTFTISVASSVVCGTAIDFSLSVTSNLGTTVTTFRKRVGTASGTDPVVTYTRDTSPDLAIPDGRPRAVFDQMTVTDDFEIADLDFRADSVTHTWTGDLTLMLRSPAGIGVDSISLIGGISDGGPGDNMVNMVVDDDVASIAANDMVQATAAAAPFTKSWLPVFNAPWPALAGFPPEDPVGTFSRYDGASTAGTWSVAVSDQFNIDVGTLNAWSMLVTPVHFACAPFAGSNSVSGTKTVSGPFTVGSTVTYTVTLINSGTATQLDNPGDEFIDVLPAAGLTLVSAIATSGTAAAGGNTVTWNGVIAPLGGSVTITITATINAGTQGTTISNQGGISYDADNNGTNEAAGVTDDPGVGGSVDPTLFQVPAAVVFGTKTVSGTFSPGGAITYTVVLSNVGTAAQPDNPGNELSDVLPASLTLVSASATSGTAVATVGTNTVTWNGSIPPSGSVTITINATIKPTAGGATVSNQGTINYDNDVNGTNEAAGVTDDPAVGGSIDPTDFIVANVDITGTKTVTGTFRPTGAIVYTVVLTNNGNTAQGDNPGNEFTDVLPVQLTLVSATATSGATAVFVGSRTVTWSGAISAGGTVTITINATVNGGTGGQTVDNQGTFVYDADVNGTNETSGVTDDPTPPGATDFTSFLVLHTFVTATKTVAGTFQPNGAIAYTVILTNGGNLAQADTPGEHEFVDGLSTRLTIGSASATSGTTSVDAGTNTARWNGAIAVGGTVTITINATIKATSGGLTVSNQGLTQFDVDGNGSNESAAATDDPGAAGTNNPTVFFVTCPTIGITPNSLAPIAAGTAVNETFVAGGGAGGYTYALTGTLPTGLSFANGVLSGTPTQTGSFPVTITTTDANGCTGNITLTIQVTCPTITVSPTSVAPVAAGTAINQTFTAAGGIGTVTFALTGTLPTGVTFANGVLSGTPTQTGNFPVTVTATDANGCTGTVTLTLQVTCPTITVSPNSVAPVTAGTAINQTFTSTGGIGTVTYALTGTLPTGVSFANGVLSGTPTQTGNFPITVTATDANGCTGSVTLTIQVTCPTITVSPNSIPAVAAGTAINHTFTQSGGIGTATFALTGTLPTGVTFVNGVLSGTPTQTGSFPITVTATDANGCTGTVTITIQVTCPTITVSPTSVPPVAAGTAINRTFTAAGGIGTVTFALTGTLPTGVTFANGVLSGTPTQTGNFPITVTATDANGCTGTVTLTLQVTCPTITVSPTSVPPVAAGTAINRTFTAAGGIGTVTFALTGTLPTGVSFANGVLSGTPTQTGNFPITVTATDANGCTGTVTLTLQVTCPTITIAPTSLPTLTQSLAFTQTFTATGGAGAATFALTGALPTGLTFSAGGVLSGTPTQAGSFPVTITATRSGCSGVLNLTIVVQSAAPTLTINTPGGGSNFSPTSSFVTVTGTAKDEGTITKVSWVNSLGGSGDATLGAIVPDGPDVVETEPLAPTTVSWSAVIPLQSGVNTLTFTATNDKGISASQATTANLNTLLYGLSEGVTGTFFDTFMLVANPTATAAPLTLTYLKEDGTTATDTRLVPPTTRITIPTRTLSGLAGTTFAPTVRSTSAVPVIIERSTFWDASFYAGGVAQAQDPGTSWYFAEGSQQSQPVPGPSVRGFDSYLLIGNANNQSALVTARFFTEGGAQVTRTYAVTPLTRQTIFLGSIPELVGTGFGMEVLADVPVTVERSMYFGPGFQGGHVSSGLPALGTTFVHPEGATGSFFDTYFLLVNPGAVAATVTMTYRLEDGSVIPITRVVPAGSRLTIDAEREDARLASANFWTSITSTQPIATERSMYWPDGLGTWVEGHCSAGTALPATKWGLAEGAVGGPIGFQTFYLLANPTNTPAAVTIRFLRGDGTTLDRAVTVPAQSRLTYYVNKEVSALVDESFGALITSTNGVPIAVERSLYWKAKGQTFGGGSNATAVRVP